jgi:hypothetical protein
MAIFDLSAMIEKLSQAQPVQEAIANLVQIKNNHANSMIRMDSRFDEQEKYAADFMRRLDAIEANQDKIIMYFENPSKMVPAADDGLQKLLADTVVFDCPVDGCTNTAVHGHPELSPTNSYQVRPSDFQESQDNGFDEYLAAVARNQRMQ